MKTTHLLISSPNYSIEESECCFDTYACVCNMCYRCQNRMSKRTTDMAHEEVNTKKSKVNKKELDFDGLDKEIKRQIKEAVSMAILPDSKQPILLELHGEEPYLDDTVAYWPASQEVGEWLLQALVLLEKENLDKHVLIAQVLGSLCDSDYRDAYKGYFNDAIHCAADLGKFHAVSTDRYSDEDCDGSNIVLTSLSTWLYAHHCYTFC